MEDQNFYTNHCSNLSDFITMEPWTKEQPPSTYIQIFHPRYAKNPATGTTELVPNEYTRQMNCYDSELLLSWMQDKENWFVPWVEKPGHKMNSMGMGGAPIYWGAQFLKLYGGSQVFLTVTLELERLIQSESLSNLVFDAVFDKVVRVTNYTNTQGHIGISALHGQEPGVNVYKIERMRPIPLEWGPRANHISIIISLSLTTGPIWSLDATLSDAIEEILFATGKEGRKKQIFYTTSAQLSQKMRELIAAIGILPMPVDQRNSDDKDFRYSIIGFSQHIHTWKADILVEIGGNAVRKVNLSDLEPKVESMEGKVFVLPSKFGVVNASIVNSLVENIVL